MPIRSRVVAVSDEPPPLVDDMGLAAALFPYRLPLWELDHC